MTGSACTLVVGDGIVTARPSSSIEASYTIPGVTRVMQPYLESVR